LLQEGFIYRKLRESSEHKSGGQTGMRSVDEMLCLKLLPQFSSHLNETCYT